MTQIFNGLVLPQVRSLRTLENVSDIARLAETIPNLENIPFDKFHCLFDARDAEGLSAFKKLNSIQFVVHHFDSHDWERVFDKLSFLEEVIIVVHGYRKSNVRSCKSIARFKLRPKGDGKYMESLLERLNEGFFKGPVVVDAESLIEPHTFPNLKISIDDSRIIGTKRADEKK